MLSIVSIVWHASTPRQPRGERFGDFGHCYALRRPSTESEKSESPPLLGSSTACEKCEIGQGFVFWGGISAIAMLGFFSNKERESFSKNVSRKVQKSLKSLNSPKKSQKIPLKKPVVKLAEESQKS